MWDFISDLLFDLLPRPVQWGCLVAIVVLIGCVVLWANFG